MTISYHPCRCLIQSDSGIRGRDFYLPRPQAAAIDHPPAASEPRNRPAMPESHKHSQERPITNRSGQQYPGEIAAGGPATPGGTARRKDSGAWGRTLMKSPRENPKDAVATVIEANRELTSPSYSPIFCHRIYQHPPRICPRSCPVRPTAIPRMPANLFGGGTAGLQHHHY
jgi:hypothetical protein